MGCWTHINGVVTLTSVDINDDGFYRFVKREGEVPEVVHVHYINMPAFFDACFSLSPRKTKEPFKPCIGLADDTEVEVEIDPSEVAFPLCDIPELMGGLTFNIAYNPNTPFGGDYVLTYTGSFEGTADIGAIEKWLRMIEKLFFVRSAAFVICDNECHYGKPVVLTGGIAS